MSAKSKSALASTPNSKQSAAAPRKPIRAVAKPVADSTSSQQNGRRSSVDRSPRPVTPNTSVDRPSSKISTQPEKKAMRVSKPSDIQAELNLAKEDLKKANEKLVLVEQEKAKALDELKEAQKLSEEANEKLKEALLAQKNAEDNCEIEKFRALEKEQAAIAASQSKEEQRQKELETVKIQHAADVAAFQSATQELEKVKEELIMTCEAKDQALSHVDNATKLAEVHAEKVEALSAELAQLKSVLDSRPDVDDIENDKLVLELKLEIGSLKQQLDEAKIFEVKLAEKEAALEQLTVDLEAAKMAESYARNLVDELHEKVKELRSETEEAKRLERFASESVESIIKQLEESNDSLHDAESEIEMLKEKVGLLEFSTGRQRVDLEESQRRLQLAREEASGIVEKVECLNYELETTREEKTQALNNEKLAAASVETLLEEKEKLINELEASRDEEEKSKKALENITSTLHEVSSEARDAKEKLFIAQVERESYEAQIEDLQRVLKATNEKYENMLDDAKEEIEALSNTVDQSKQDCDDLKTELEQKELLLKKKYEEEKCFMEKEIERLADLLKRTEEEATATREEGHNWKKSFEEAESQAVYLKEALGEAKAESMKLKEDLMEKENEMHNIVVEGEELRKREADSLKKAEELSMLLEEALAKKNLEEENGELTDTDNDYDMLPKVIEFSEQNGNHEAAFDDKSPQRVENSKDEEEKLELDNSAEVVENKMWESCKIDEKDLSASFEDEVDTKAEVNGVLSSTETVDDNGGSLPTSQKKKKPLLGKFGSLLKKKGTTNHK